MTEGLLSAELLGTIVAVAGGAAAAVLAVRAPSRVVVGLAFTLVVVPVAWILLDSEFRIFSHHGFLHASYVEAILERGLPPTDPLLAGRPLGYAWIHHAAIAGLVLATGSHASTVFAVTNVLLAALCCMMLVAIARRVFPDSRGALVLAPLLALYGASPFPRGPLARGLGALGLSPEGRLIPIQKFASVNSNQLGISCFVWGCYAWIRLADRGEPARRGAAAHLFGAVALAALVYPLAWAPLVATAGLATVLVAAQRRDWRAAVLPLASIGSASLLVGPYLWSLQAGKSTASLGFDVSWAHVSAGVAQALLVLGPPLLLLVWLRFNGEREVPAPGSGWLLASIVGVGGILHLVVAAGMGSEYKFLALAALGAGFALGGALAPFVRRRPSIGALLLALLLLPAGSFFPRAALFPWGDSDRVRVAGRHLEVVDADRQALHEWLREATPPEAVFVDSELDLPVYTGRRLYVAHDPASGGAPGWGVLPSRYLTTVVGHPAALVHARSRVSRRLLAGEATSADLAALVRELGPTPLYVIARGPRARGHLRGVPGFEESFASGSLGAYHLLR